MTYDDGLRQYTTERPFEGVLPNMERRFRETDSAWVRGGTRAATRAPRPARCASGDRLKPEALAVKIAGSNISEVARAVDRRRRRLVLRRRRDADPEPAARSPRAS